jgi:hypothetical protein
MKRLVEYPLKEGGSILVQVDEPEPEGIVRVAREGEIAQASQTFEESMERIRPVAASLIAKMRNISDPPDEVNIDFGLNMSAKAGAFIAEMGTEANFKISLKWKKN